MPESKEVYARKALSQIPRILGNQDRNPFSPTYGCFHRDYWLDKTSDFPDAVRQFGVQSLALVYARDFPGNIYRANPKIRQWTLAGMDYWTRIQHGDGSFDEFYPNERGWVGPTAFTTYTTAEAYKLLEGAIPDELATRVKAAIRKAALFIAAGESEEDHLANHYAMACLAVWKAYRLLGDEQLRRGFDRLWQGYLAYHNDEGWSREYDGIDPGYLSATISFFAKIYQDEPLPQIRRLVEKYVELCSFFAYPDGFYAGSTGSRNTLHFYCHGFEVFAKEIPLAAAVAEQMLCALGQDKLVSPEIMSDRYVFYRVPELLQSYSDYAPRPALLPPLPWQRPSQHWYFPQARIWAKKQADRYYLANLAKGGVVKVFDCVGRRLAFSDSGILGQLDNGSVATSQWVDPQYQCRAGDNGWEVSGQLNLVPSNKRFTPSKQIVFRMVLLLLGWQPRLAHWLKGQIRKMLMLGNRRVPVRFRRTFSVAAGRAELRVEMTLDAPLCFRRLRLGDEFFVRYVPQSRYFQSFELDVEGHDLTDQQLQEFRRQRRYTLVRSLDG